MKKDRTIISGLFMVLALITFSCKKESNTSTPDNDCRLVKSIGLLGRGGNYIDTAIYEYSNRLVSRISLSYGATCDISYQNGQLSKTEYSYSFLPGVRNVITLNYNTDGTLKEFNRYSITNVTDTLLFTSNTLTYQNNLLYKVKYREHNSATNTLEHKTDVYFTWDNGNISVMKTHRQEHPFDTITGYFSYDTKDNYFRRFYGNVSHPLMDPYFMFPTVGDLPFLLSRNNLTGFPGISGLSVSYPENSLGYPEAMYWNNDLNLRYFYSCE